MFAEFSVLQALLIGLCFAFSGFVRSGLGFGGTLLALPFLLLVYNDALFFLPILSTQLLVTSFLMVFGERIKTLLSSSTSTPETLGVDWSYLGRALLIMLIPKLIGVAGLVTLPDVWVNTSIFIIVLSYGLGYIFDRPIRSAYRWLDIALLIVGAYASGISLLGAPLIIAVFSQHVARHNLRNTLFALWMILVLIKTIGLLYAGVDMQWIHHLWLTPCVWVGHKLGMAFYRSVERSEPADFYRVLGFALVLASLFGLHGAWDRF